jgi:hypothetical protein
MITADTTKPAAKARPVFTLQLQPLPGVDGIRSFRALVKVALRRFELRAIDVRETIEEQQ